jgi:hypothetical protein
MEIVCVEAAAAIAAAAVTGAVFVVEGLVAEGLHPTLTYDNLIEKIFLSEHIVVV